MKFMCIYVFQYVLKFNIAILKFSLLEISDISYIQNL